MKALHDPVLAKMCRNSFSPARLNGRPNAQRRASREKAAQLIYAHLPPAAVLATEQHLRVQTQIERRAQRLWIAGGCHPGSALNDWLRAESEVVQNLCKVFLRQDIPESEPEQKFINDCNQVLMGKL